MRESLDYSKDEFKKLLDLSTELVLKKYDAMEHGKGYHDHPQKEVESWFNEPLPEDGISFIKLLEEVEERILNTATGNLGPHMYAYVMSGGNQVAIAAEKLAATINQNQTKWHLAPALNEVDSLISDI